MRDALQAKRLPLQLSPEPSLCCQCLRQMPLQRYQQLLAWKVIA